MKGQGRRKVNKLASRVSDFDRMKSEGGNGPNSKWVKTMLGKNQMFHRPGSNK